MHRYLCFDAKTTEFFTAAKMKKNTMQPAISAILRLAQALPCT